MQNDSWCPSAAIEIIKARAEKLRTIRAFFSERGLLEVETPVLGRGGSTDVHLDSLSLMATTPSGQERLWLQTSPEFHMKRLLAAGSGPIFQLARVFRDGEVGQRHNIEFTMLEWYRPGWTLTQLSEEVDTLIRHVLANDPGPTRWVRYRDLFRDALGLDPFTASIDRLRDEAFRIGNIETKEWTRDDCLDLLMSLVIEPMLGRRGIDIVIDYPASQASLAKCKHDEDGSLVAARFEIYLNGIELANGYDELLEAEEQKARFDADNKARMALNKPQVEADHHLVAALEAGMPPCSGVALGVDRLIMLALDKSCLEEVVAFSSRNC
ncbi:EF-P lysine aminoacylase EpmA [Phytohalomonas tamaricis]|uniref:EF-P lysine aminoacylase EpmA n=1 Tax=Phytohalomonas tamaricis TaxID=2081032 RepID=UPI000D0BE9DB|nr:EF-P lysine aminoacylase EpmA [Phytohalomonas tamaricis]